MRRAAPRRVFRESLSLFVFLRFRLFGGLAEEVPAAEEGPAAKEPEGSDGDPALALHEGEGEHSEGVEKGTGGEAGRDKI